MFRSCLYVAVIAYFLMQIFIDIRKVCVCMDAGSRDFLRAFSTAIITDDLLTSVFAAGCLFNSVAGLPLMITGLL